MELTHTPWGSKGDPVCSFLIYWSSPWKAQGTAAANSHTRPRPCPAAHRAFLSCILAFGVVGVVVAVEEEEVVVVVGGGDGGGGSGSGGDGGSS